MRRGLKSSTVTANLLNGTTIRRFPDEEGTEMLTPPLKVSAFCTIRRFPDEEGTEMAGKGVSPSG